MNEADAERLSRIETQWTAVLRAHDPGTESARDVRDRLVVHYSGAVYRYLLGATRDPEVAADLCQEFAVRFLRGDFRRAAPDRGRFRDYVKTALANLVNDHHRARRAGPMPLVADPPAADPASEDDFLAGWQQSLLDQTWKALAADNPTFHAVLLLRVENPEMPSPEMAERLSAQLDKPVTPENVRKSLQRAHAKFADLLLERVVQGLDNPTDDELDDELRALDLLRYCRSALDRRRAGS